MRCLRSGWVWIQFSGLSRGEAESGPFVHFGLSPNCSSMLLEDAIDSGQAYACSFEFAFVMEALENAKQLLGIFHVEAGPVVAHEMTAGWPGRGPRNGMSPGR
jgi:hypothetical protein